VSDVNIGRTEAALATNQIALDENELLMKRVANRDVGAFERLYDRHHQLVYGIAIRMLHEQAAAQDVTQAVFATLWSAPSAFRGGHFAAWLGRVTRNRCLDEMRIAAHFSPEASPEDAGSQDAETAAFARMDASNVYAALSTLSTEHRRVIELAYFEGLTQRQIADKMGLPLGTVKSRIRNGLVAMRNALMSTRP